MLRELQSVERVEEAGSAGEAITLIDTFRPGVIVLDLHMPGGNGLGVLSRVKGGQPPRPIVIVVTNDASEQQRQECIRRGADYFFDKSIDFDKVLDIVAAAARSNRAP
jgi:DNA-binding NarL/FixJ family response regulator